MAPAKALDEALRRISFATAKSDGAQVARALTLQLSPKAPIVSDMRSTTKEHILRRVRPLDYADMLQEHFLALYALVVGDTKDAFGHQVKLAAVLRERLAEEAWLLPVLCCVGRDLRRLCLKAINDGVAVHEISSSAIDALTRMFKAVNSDPGTKSAALNFVNDTVRVHFKTNHLNLANNLVRSHRMSGKSPKAEVVTFNFYAGRLALLQDRMAEAQEKLEEALSLCPSWAHRQRQQILSFLVPVKVLSGTIPSDALLRRYSLETQFGPLVRALKMGDVGLFDRSLLEREVRLMRNGTFLVVERWQLLVYRRLFQRLFFAFGANNRLRLSYFRNALSLMKKEELSVDEVQCIVAGMCAKGIVRGSVFRSHDLCAVSKENPFPSLKK